VSLLNSNIEHYLFQGNALVDDVSDVSINSLNNDCQQQVIKQQIK
jgi:hypothetical protein